MKSFRLARLLSLREDQAKAEKIRWALAVRAAREAAEEADAARVRIRSAAQEISDSLAQDGPRTGRAMAATVCGYDTLDALGEHAGRHDEALVDAQRAAAEARSPYDERRREVEALRRLEERWTKERRRTRRRAENRDREEFINGQFRPITNAAPETEEA